MLQPSSSFVWHLPLLQGILCPKEDCSAVANHFIIVNRDVRRGDSKGLDEPPFKLSLNNKPSYLGRLNTKTSPSIFHSIYRMQLRMHVMLMKSPVKSSAT